MDDVLPWRIQSGILKQILCLLITFRVQNGQNFEFPAVSGTWKEPTSNTAVAVYVKQNWYRATFWNVN
jgi:hypothetical protein